ncbi:MAG: transglutaminase-like cysteine peptidase [Beijerinckiaceae bacterium]|nr:transglutaminase-like cysteine peptidase [Beijerinckiaceae bacterium]
MKDRTAALAFVVLSASFSGIGAALPSYAAPVDAAAPAPRGNVPVRGPASVPYGWEEFCWRHAAECNAGPLEPLDVKLTPEKWKLVEGIHKRVNAWVKPVPDMEHWGIIDRWNYPIDGKGDCEDFALLKRSLLIEEGFPRQALLMTVVKDERNEGHAVLTIKTTAGEFVLDNMNDEVMPWDRTGYRFVKRQSQIDQNLWVQIGDPTAAPDYVSR